MRRFYYRLADKLRYFSWGRSLVDHFRRHQRLYENMEALYTALVLALIIKTFVFEAYKIPSSSMYDTLREGDRIFVSKFIYDLQPIEIGDVIVFKTFGIDAIYDPEKPYYIKRVVGLPGDEIQITPDNKLMRNGELLTEPDIFLENEYYPIRTNAKTRFKVPEGQVYVFGDNSDNSWDSRAWGGVPIENVMGKAFFRYWPISRIGLIEGVPPEYVREKNGNTSIVNKKFSLPEANAAEHR
ncbi:MAG: signal peptidase I [bacterium]|jgi:signal peptidase I